VQPAKETVVSRPSGARGALTLMVGTLASRITGLVRSSLMVNVFPTPVLAAFFVAWRIPNLFRELLAEGALINSFVPVYKSLSPKERSQLSGALFKLLLGANAVLIGLAIWAAPWIIPLLLEPGTTIDVDLAVTLARLVFPFLATISFAALAMGILNAEERFFAPAWAPVAFNAVAIVLMLLFRGQATMLALAFVLGGLAQLLVQVPVLLRLGLFPALSSWWHVSLPRVLTLALPFAFTTGARQFLNIVGLRVLSALPEADANVVAFENAFLIFMLALALFSVSPSLAFFSRLSADAHEAPERFSETLLQGLRFITFLTVPAGLLILVLAEPAVETLFNWRDRQDLEHQRMLGFSVLALFPLGLAVFPWGLVSLLIRPFYVRETIRPPIVVSVIFFTLNGLLYYLLAPLYGIAGMSWATVMAGWLQVVVLLYWMRRREGLDLRAFMAHALKVWVAAGIAAGLAYLVLLAIPFPQTWLGFVLQVVIGGGVAGAVFAALALVLRLPELEGVMRRFRTTR
jgi:putative peptidoglycan lipid II flippase